MLEVSTTIQQLLSQPASTERWSEVIGDFWESLPYIKKTKQIDRNNSFTVQYGEKDESCSDTETWIQCKSEICMYKKSQHYPLLTTFS